MPYTERELGAAVIYEHDGHGNYRAILENGNTYWVRQSGSCLLNVGDIGVVVYCSDGKSYGLPTFRLKDDVQINFDLLTENYNKRWNANIQIVRPQHHKEDDAND